MIFISHRGNISGRYIERENEPNYILEAKNMGYQVEIDVWNLSGKWYLGHDEPQYSVEESFFSHEGMWCHAKNLEALDALLSLKTNCFWHQEDDYTLTSKGIIWAYPGKKLNKNSICVMPEWNKKTLDFSLCMGICSDLIKNYKEMLNGS